MYAARMLSVPLRSRGLQFRGLADDTRLRILEVLGSGEHCVCELIETLGLAQSLLSFHLKALKQAGLVTDRREGRWTYYALNEAALKDMAAVLTQLSRRARRPEPRAPRCD